jgi:hypothetical protein
MLDLNLTRTLHAKHQSRLNTEKADHASRYIQNVLSDLQCATPEDLGDVDKSTQKKEIVFILQTSYGQMRTIKLTINISEQPFKPTSTMSASSAPKDGRYKQQRFTLDDHDDHNDHADETEDKPNL